MRAAALLVIFIALIALPMSALAHGGGLDSNGGHNDRKTGTYHFHRGPLAGRSFPSKATALRSLASARKPKPPSGLLSRDDPADAIKRASTTKKIDALIRLLVRKKVITEGELASEIKRGK